MDAEVDPAQPRPGASASIVVYDTGACESYSPDLNGVTHDLRRDGFVIELDLMFAGPCSIPTPANEHRFSTEALLVPGEYQLRIYDAFRLGGSYTFPVDPEDRELIYETTFTVGGEPVVVPALGWVGILVLLTGVFGMVWYLRPDHVRPRPERGCAS